MTTASKSLMALCAADIMSRNITIIPREMSLQGAARLLTHACVTGAPIVDAEGRCVGVLSSTDIMHSIDKESHTRHKTRDHFEPITNSWQIPSCSTQTEPCVEDYMTKDPVLVDPDTSIGQLARMMMEAHIHRIIVVAKASQRPLGIVSSLDILAAVARVEQAPMATAVRQDYATTAGMLR